MSDAVRTNRPVSPCELSTASKGIGVNKAPAFPAESEPIRTQPTIQPVGEASRSVDEESLPFSIETLIKQFRGKFAIVRQVLCEFETEAVADMKSLAKGLKAGDGQRIASVAHGLKGAAGLLCADEIRSLAAELEQQGLRGELEGAEDRLAELGKEIDRCLAYISVARREISEPGESGEAHAPSDR